MRKRIIVLLSLFILLAACGKTENDLDKSENDQEITIPNEYEIEEKKLLKELDKDKNEIGNYIKLKELYLKYDEGEKADLIIDKALEKFVSRDEKLVLNMEKADTLNHLGDWEEAEEILLRMYGNMKEDKDYIGPNPVSRSEIYLKLGDIYYENDQEKYIKLQDDWNKFLEEEELVRFVQLLIEKDEIQRLNEFLEKIDMRRLEKTETIRVLSQYFNSTYMDVLLDKLIYSTSQSDIKGSGSKFFKYWYDNLIREYEIKGIYVDHNHIVLGDSDGIRDIYAVLENGSDYFIYTMDGVTGKVIDVIQGEGINDEYEIYFDQKLISVYGGKGINDSVRMLHLIRRNMEDERLDLYTENIELYKGFPGTLKFEKVEFDLHEELEVKTKDKSELIIIHPERGEVSISINPNYKENEIYSVNRYVVDEDYSIFERETELYLDRERSKKVGSYKFIYIWDLEEEEILLDNIKIYNQKGIEI